MWNYCICNGNSFNMSLGNLQVFSSILSDVSLQKFKDILLVSVTQKPWHSFQVYGRMKEWESWIDPMTSNVFESSGKVSVTLNSQYSETSINAINWQYQNESTERLSLQNTFNWKYYSMAIRPIQNQNLGKNEYDKGWEEIIQCKCNTYSLLPKKL